MFLAGRERLIGPSGRLGFHQEAELIGSKPFAGPRGQAVMTRNIAALRKLGISEAFAKRVVAPLPGELWYPSVGELLAEKIVTRAADPSEVAALPRICRAPAAADRHAYIAFSFLQAGATHEVEFFDRAIQKYPNHSGLWMYRAMLQTPRAIAIAR